MATTIIVFVLIIGVFLFVKNEQREHEAAWIKAQAAVYLNHCTPVVIGQCYIDQPLSELQELADHWRERLKASGNPYAEIIPVTVFQYQAALTDNGNIAMSWGLYEKALAYARQQALIQWAESCPLEIRHLVTSGTIAA